MSSHLPPPAGALMITRRRVLLAGATLVAGGLLSTSLPAFALPVPAAGLADFMQISRLLVNHQLSETVGQRMLALLNAEQPELQSALAQLLNIAQQRNATLVEEFFADIPAGKLQDLAHRIIFGWYTGSLEPGRGAKTFAYEQALTWHTTLDVIAVPSYGLSGPNNWTRTNTPVLPLPAF